MARRNRTAALHNLGCKVNAYETEVMQSLLEDAGYTIVPFDERADVYIINTCSVTNIADRKSRQMLHRARKQNPDAVVVAAGCYVQTATERTGLIVDADILIGSAKKSSLVEALDKWFAENEDRAERSRSELVDDISRGCEYEPLARTRVGEHERTIIKIQDGCNQFCSYCIIPYARGRIRSRKPEEIYEEVRRLADAGVNEFVLTGIHLSSYGADFSEKNKEGFAPEQLLEVIKGTAAIEGVQRIRLGSLEPRIITEDFARELSSVKELCPHFHLSLQSGCDSVLRRMNRHYTAAEYLERLAVLRRFFDDPAITTDVIAGFPGESEEEFEETSAFLDRAGLYETHIFRYSVRKGTRAAAMDGQIEEQEKARRSRILEAGDEKRRRAYEMRHIGKRAELLLEDTAEVDGTLWITGHTREYIKAAVRKEDKYTGGMILQGTLESVPGVPFPVLSVKD